jgi:hypothetical protein
MGIFRITMNQMVSHIEWSVDGCSVLGVAPGDNDDPVFTEPRAGARPQTGR